MWAKCWLTFKLKKCNRLKNNQLHFLKLVNGGVGGVRTLVQTTNFQAFYMFSF
jgi:hypothetical protein